jgi:hypothetical protein
MSGEGVRRLDGVEVGHMKATDCVGFLGMKYEAMDVIL